MRRFLALIILLASSHVYAVTRHVDNKLAAGTATYVPATRAATGGSATVYLSAQECINASATGDICQVHGADGSTQGDGAGLTGVYDDCADCALTAGTREVFLCFVGKTSITVNGYGDGTVTFDPVADACDFCIWGKGSASITVGGTTAATGLTCKTGFDFADGAHAHDDANINFQEGTGSHTLQFLTDQGNELSAAAIAREPQNIAVMDNDGDLSVIKNNTITMKDEKYGMRFWTGSDGCTATDTCPVNAPQMLDNSCSAFDTAAWRTCYGFKNAEGGSFLRNTAVIGTASSLMPNGARGFQLRDGRGQTVANNYFAVFGSPSDANTNCFFGQGGGIVNVNQKIYNNTCYGSGKRGFWLACGTGVEFRNNIVHGSSASAFDLGVTIGSTCEGNFGYNSFFNIDATDYWGAGNATCTDALGAIPGAIHCDADNTNKYNATDPLLVGAGDQPTPFLRLQSGSPLIGLGVIDADGPTTDYDGVTRGSPVDMGADEYAASADSTAPSAISTLATGSATTTSLTLTWTAVGDDAGSGTATSYDCRYAAGASTVLDSDDEFTTASLISAATTGADEPTPAVAGTATESVVVSNLAAGTAYAFACKVSDEVPNTSALSNTATGTTSSATAAIRQPVVKAASAPSGASTDLQPKMFNGGYYENVSSTWTQLFQLPNGASPTVDAAGEMALDTTGPQLLVYDGVAARAVPIVQTVCKTFENLADSDDNYEIFATPVAVTVTSVGCHCRGTCTTKATIVLEDRGGNSVTGTPTCSETTGNTTFTSVSAAGAFGAGEGVRFDVTNTPSPLTDEYTICFTYTVDRL
jgi:hypothetical protein